MRPITLLTGASAGIGTALAHEFADRGHELVLVARREQRLNTLADAIAASGHPRPVVLPIDLQNAEAGLRIAAAFTERGLEPNVVVNNAGFGLVGLAAELDISEQREMIDVNVSALTDLSLRFTASLERHKGGILNVASVAGFMPGPRSAVYYATKAYVLSFTEASASGTEAARHPRHRALSRPGADRVPGARRRAGSQRSGLAHALGGAGRKTRLSRLHAGPPHRGAGFR